MKTKVITSICLFVSIITFGQKLKKGNIAPPINVKSAQGEMINLENYKGKTVLITFLRFAGCPVCNVRIHNLIEDSEELKKANIEVIAVYESSNETLSKYIKDVDIPFAMIGDPKHKLYKKYKVQKSITKMMRTMTKKKPKEDMKEGEKMYQGIKYKKDGSMIRIPADFIIDTTGSIKIAHYGKYIGDHISIESLTQ